MSSGNSKVPEPQNLRAAEVRDKIAQHILQLEELKERVLNLRMKRVRAHLDRVRNNEEIPELKRRKIKTIRDHILYSRHLIKLTSKSIDLMSEHLAIYQFHQQQQKRDEVMQSIIKISSRNDSWIRELENEIRVAEAKLDVL